jgi:DNA polymerase-3 subunit delta'
MLTMSLAPFDFNQLDLSLLPKEQTHLVGLDKFFLRLKNLYDIGEFPSCLLLHGRKGIGKATLGFHLANYILSKNERNPFGLSSELVKRQIIIGSYPNLCVLEKEKNVEKEDKGKSDKGSDGILKNEITIDQVRKCHHFLMQHPFIEGFRVVIVDAVDELNRFGANSLLKRLEEPSPHLIFILIAHNLSKVLPTILSRTQRVDLYFDIESLRQKNIQEGIPEDIILFSENLGEVVQLQKCGVDFIQTLTKAIDNSFLDLGNFSKNLAKNPIQYEVFFWLIEKIIYSLAKKASASSKKRYLKIYEEVTQLLRDSEKSHLDKAHLVFAVFSICKEV